MSGARPLALLLTLVMAPAGVHARTADEELKLGAAHLKAGEREQAREAFLRALGKDPTAGFGPGASSGRAEALLREVRGGMKGTLVVLVRQGSGQVRVDGRVVGETPFMGEVSVGRHMVEVRSGARRQARSLVVYHGIKTELFLRNWPASTGYPPGRVLAGVAAGGLLIHTAGDPVQRLFSLAVSLIISAGLPR